MTSRINLFTNVLLAPVWSAVLLAKELAGIDAVSGGRLTLGLGIVVRSDDFVAAGHGLKARGKRFDADLEIYRDVWAGKPCAGSTNPVVPAGTRQIPIVFGGSAPATFARARLVSAM